MTTRVTVRVWWPRRRTHKPGVRAGRWRNIPVHFFGSATVPFSKGVMMQNADVFEIEAVPFTLHVRNTLAPMWVLMLQTFSRIGRVR